MKTKTITLKGYIGFDTFKAKHPHSFPEGPFSWSSYDPTGMTDKVLVGEQAITVEVPENFDPRPRQIEALREKQRQAEAAFSKLVTEINRQISELQAIEYSGETA